MAAVDPTPAGAGPVPHAPVSPRMKRFLLYGLAALLGALLLSRADSRRMLLRMIAAPAPGIEDPTPEDARRK